jgi:hypothetical protein
MLRATITRSEQPQDELDLMTDDLGIRLYSILGTKSYPAPTPFCSTTPRTKLTKLALRNSWLYVFVYQTPT